MNIDVVERIADAVLYEGYVLYPYRASAVKNRQRFNFGVLYPPRYCELNAGSDAWEMRTECLIEGDLASTLEVKVRFLQMAERESWQEGIERDISTPACAVAALLGAPLRCRCAFGPLQGEVELSVSRAGEGVFKVTLLVRNISNGGDPGNMRRNDALLLALVSVHSILRVQGGRFLSAIDPPEGRFAAAAECRNVGTWPVLAGEDGQTDLMLSSPIILYDYPRIAPESAGDLCDGTEIDEILALRILTMTEAEKLEVREGDDRARRILERTEMLPPAHFEKLHGALRSQRS